MADVKDIKPPKSKKSTGRKKPKSSDDGPAWELKDDGTRKRRGRALPLENKLKELFAALAGGAALAGSGFTAAAIEAKADELAYGWARLAQENTNVKYVLTTLLEGSAWSEAVIPTVGLVIVVGWHYGFIPDRVGQPMALANGLMPITRTQEQEMKAQHAAEQAQAEAEHRRRRTNGASGDSTSD